MVGNLQPIDVPCLHVPSLPPSPTRLPHTGAQEPHTSFPLPPSTRSTTNELIQSSSSSGRKGERQGRSTNQLIQSAGRKGEA